MLKRVKEKVVRRKVDINVPADGEGFEKGTVWITFEIAKHSEANASVFGMDFFLKHIRNLEDYFDEDGTTQIPFNKETLKEFLELPYCLAGVQRAYIDITVAAGRGN
jgi:hypothetical protein